MKTQKAYTISTQVFSTITEAKKKLVEYAEKGDYRKDSKIFEATKVYEVDIVKVARLRTLKVAKPKPLKKAEEDPLTLH